MADRSPPPLFDDEDDTFEEILESEVLPKSDVTTTEKNVVATSDVVVKSEQLPLTESTTKPIPVEAESNSDIFADEEVLLESPKVTKHESPHIAPTVLTSFEPVEPEEIEDQLFHSTEITSTKETATKTSTADDVKPRSASGYDEEFSAKLNDDDFRTSSTRRNNNFASGAGLFETTDPPFKSSKTASQDEKRNEKPVKLKDDDDRYDMFGSATATAQVGLIAGSASAPTGFGSSTASAPAGFRVAGRQGSVNGRLELEESKYSIEIKISDYKKIGDGMNAFMTFKVSTKTTIPDFRKSEMDVYRRFSDFLGLHEKLIAKHVHHGRIVPPPPEKSVIGMTKIKMSKEEVGAANSAEFLVKRKASLERFLNRIAQHPTLQTDPNFVDFLELDGDLPKSSSTSALSGAGLLRLFSRAADSIGKMAYKMEETDPWFEDKTQATEELDIELRRLLASIESLICNRKDLADSTGMLAKSVGLLGIAEEHTTLSRALSKLAEVEEKVDLIHLEQAENDFFIFEELIKDYIGLMQSIKDVFNERSKQYKTLKDDEVMLAKKREVKVRMELSHKLDKISEASHEITECEHKLEKSQEDFDSISKSIRKELANFEKQRCKDFKTAIIAYLESLLESQQQLLKNWETFLPEARLID